MASPRRCHPSVLSSIVVVCLVHRTFLTLAWWFHISWVCACPVVAGGGRGWVSWVLVVVCSMSCCLHVVVLLAHCCVVFALLCCFRIVVLFLHCCVISAFWLSSLGGHGGGCCRSWTADIGWVQYNLEWGRRGSKADVGCHWAVC